LKSVKWCEGVEVREVPIPPIPQGWVLGKVLTAMTYSPKLTGFSEVMIRNVTLGSFGVVRVVEAGVESNVVVGKIYGVVPFCGVGFLGLDVDGLLSEYSVIPSTCLIELKGEPIDKYSSLYIEFSYVEELLKIARRLNSAIIVGCDFTSYVLSLSLKSLVDVTAFCNDEVFKPLHEVGISVRKDLSELRSYDLAIITENPRFEITKYLTNAGIIYLTPKQPHITLRYFGQPKKVSLVRPSRFNYDSGRKALSGIVKYVLESNVAFTNDFNEVKNLVEVFPRVSYVASNVKQ